MDKDNVTSWTGLKLEDAVRKVDNRSEWRTTIHSAAYLGVRQGKAKIQVCRLQNVIRCRERGMTWCTCAGCVVGQMWNAVTGREKMDGSWSLYADQCCLSIDGQHVGVLRRHENGR